LRASTAAIEWLVSGYALTSACLLVVGGRLGDHYGRRRWFSIGLAVFVLASALCALAPDPATNKNVHFLKYPVYLGGNRGRGQVYPTGEKSNNTVFTASVSGRITAITPQAEGGYQVTIQPEEGDPVVETIPPGPQLIVAVGDTVAADAPLTDNPNVGGFGQAQREIVLQSPTRLKWLMAFLATVALAQVLLVLKKRQWEKVQAQMEF
ncbi:MAG: MFS transporter, partial [Gloeomargarita sp. GMQP_bins_5]